MYSTFGKKYPKYLNKYCAKGFTSVFVNYVRFVFGKRAILNGLAPYRKGIFDIRVLITRQVCRYLISSIYKI